MSYINIMTFVRGQWRTIPVVASMPFIPGNPISMSAGSGLILSDNVKLGSSFENGLDSVTQDLVVVDKENSVGHGVTGQSRVVPEQCCARSRETRMRRIDSMSATKSSRSARIAFGGMSRRYDFC